MWQEYIKSVAGHIEDTGWNVINFKNILRKKREAELLKAI